MAATWPRLRARQAEILRHAGAATTDSPRRDDLVWLVGRYRRSIRATDAGRRQRRAWESRR